MAKPDQRVSRLSRCHSHDHQLPAKTQNRLALLHLGVKGIRLGPSLPAFLTPNVLDTLVRNFDIKPIGTPEEDLRAILA